MKTMNLRGLHLVFWGYILDLLCTLLYGSQNEIVCAILGIVGIVGVVLTLKGLTDLVCINDFFKACRKIVIADLIVEAVLVVGMILSAITGSVQVAGGNIGGGVLGIGMGIILLVTTMVCNMVFDLLTFNYLLKGCGAVADECGDELMAEKGPRLAKGYIIWTILTIVFVIVSFVTVGVALLSFILAGGANMQGNKVMSDNALAMLGGSGILGIIFIIMTIVAMIMLMIYYIRILIYIRKTYRTFNAD